MTERERIDELTAIAREHDLDALSVRFGDVTYDLTLREPAVAAAPAAAGVVPAATPDGPAFAGLPGPRPGRTRRRSTRRSSAFSTARRHRATTPSLKSAIGWHPVKCCAFSKR